jgi:hypothetical protein
MASIMILPLSYRETDRLKVVRCIGQKNLIIVELAGGGNIKREKMFTSYISICIAIHQRVPLRHVIEGKTRPFITNTSLSNHFLYEVNLICSFYFLF